MEISPLDVSQGIVHPNSFNFLPRDVIDEGNYAGGFFRENIHRSNGNHRTTSMTLQEVIDQKERVRSFIIVYLLAGLSFTQKKIIILRHFRELPIRKIAGRLKISEKEVRTNLSEISLRMHLNLDMISRKRSVQ